MPTKRKTPRPIDIYLAAPYISNRPTVIQARVDATTECQSWLTAIGHSSIAPTVIGHQLCRYSYVSRDFPHWYEWSLGFLEVCRKLLVLKLPGWTLSKGVNEELIYASKHHLPVAFIGPHEIGWSLPSFQPLPSGSIRNGRIQIEKNA